MSNYNKNIDYLDEDEIIDRQLYCCLSFAEPADEIEKHYERYIFNKFLKHLSKNFILTPRILSTGEVSIQESHEETLKVTEEVTQEVTEKVTEEVTEEVTQEVTEKITEEVTQEVTENVTEEVQEEKAVNELEDQKICHKKLFEEYIGFMTVNYNNLIKKYVEKYGHKNCIRAIKIRGSYRNLEQAQKRAKQLQQIDDFNVFVGEVGKWGPFNPININDVDAEYLDDRLNELIHKNKEELCHKELLFNDRKRKLQNKKTVNKK